MATGPHAFRFFFNERRETPSWNAFWRVAPSVRFSLRAITLAFSFARARVRSSRTSSFVHERFTDFRAIVVPHNAFDWRRLYHGNLKSIGIDIVVINTHGSFSRRCRSSCVDWINNHYACRCRRQHQQHVHSHRHRRIPRHRRTCTHALFILQTRSYQGAFCINKKAHAAWGWGASRTARARPKETNRPLPNI
jgi:hypothetical protein